MGKSSNNTFNMDKKRRYIKKEKELLSIASGESLDMILDTMGTNLFKMIESGLLDPDNLPFVYKTMLDIVKIGYDRKDKNKDSNIKLVDVDLEISKLENYELLEKNKPDTNKNK